LDTRTGSSAGCQRDDPSCRPASLRKKITHQIRMLIDGWFSTVHLGLLDQYY
jgi:hypothetical protein